MAGKLLSFVGSPGHLLMVQPKGERLKWVIASGKLEFC